MADDGTGSEMEQPGSETPRGTATGTQCREANGQWTGMSGWPSVARDGGVFVRHRTASRTCWYEQPAQHFNST